MTAGLGFMLITSAPDVARHAEQCGVDRILIDMETRGKAERQGHLDTHKSAHGPDDIACVAGALHSAELMARINPPGPELQSEVNAALDAGAQRLMLPMFSCTAEVADFVVAVGDRAPITLLVETPAALARLRAWLPLLRPGDDVHFGLNDLSLGAGLRFLFEPLAGGMLDEPAAICRDANVPFGIGGVGRVGQGDVPAEWIIGEHVRLGSQWVILSRAFHGGAANVAELEARLQLADELAQLHRVERAFQAADDQALRENQQRLARRVFELAGETAPDD